MYTSQTNLSMIFSPSKNLLMLSSVFTYLLRRKVFHSSGNLIAERYQILEGQRCRVFPGRPSVFQKLPKVTIRRVFDNNKQRPWKKKLETFFAQQLVRVRNARETISKVHYSFCSQLPHQILWELFLHEHFGSQLKQWRKNCHQD